jgi:hypothetical protein
MNAKVLQTGTEAFFGGRVDPKDWVDVAATSALFATINDAAPSAVYDLLAKAAASYPPEAEPPPDLRERLFFSYAVLLAQHVVRPASVPDADTPTSSAIQPGWVADGPPR